MVVPLIGVGSVQDPLDLCGFLEDLAPFPLAPILSVAESVEESVAEPVERARCHGDPWQSLWRELPT